MFNEPNAPERQPEGAAAPDWPVEDNDAAWERVLDCGAPGPAHAEPALFYQAGRRPPANAAASREPA